jgi:hypothetical protein
VLVSTTQDEGLIFIALKEFIDELNSNWDECIPHLLDYNYTISNEYLKTKVAQDIKKFYFGDQMVSTKTMSNIIKVCLHLLTKKYYIYKRAGRCKSGCDV